MNSDSGMLKFFAEFIEKNIGITYSETNYFQLEHRLQDMTVLLGFANLEELYKAARDGIRGNMKDMLLDAATNNETSFFRDPMLFQGLVEKIIPEWLERNPESSRLRLWSAAGSTGQEAYSLVLSLEAAKAKWPKLPDYEILVTDFSDRVLGKAKLGRYSQLEVQRGLNARQLIQNFDKVGDNEWQIKSDLQKHLRFRQLNLLDPFSDVGHFDIILCRNVLIYQSVENKTSVVSRMVDLLHDKGILVLGASESLLGVSTAFAMLNYETAVYYQKI